MKNNLILLAIAMMLVSCNKETLVETNTPAATEFNNDVALNGLFSVNEGKQVYFSKGNLQYSAQGSHQCADGTIRQLGASPKTNGITWEASVLLKENVVEPLAKAITAVCPQPTRVGLTSSAGARADTMTTETLIIRTLNHGLILRTNSMNYDWGVYNAICNGGNEEGQWRTLTMSEWNYVFNLRRTASDTRFAKATVNDVCGVILLPDDWNNSYYDLANTNEANVDYSCNMIGIAQWAVVESYGAIFLPAGGRRSGLSVESVGDAGAYWSASCFDDMFYNNNGELGVGVLFNHDKLDVNVVIQRYGGRSVRLVRDAN